MQGWHKKGVFWFIFKKPNTANKVKSVYFIADTLRITDEGGADIPITDFGYKITKLEVYGGVRSADGFETGELIGETGIAQAAITFSPARDYLDIAFLVHVNTQEVL